MSVLTHPRVIEQITTKSVRHLRADISLDSVKPEHIFILAARSCKQKFFPPKASAYFRCHGIGSNMHFRFPMRERRGGQCRAAIDIDQAGAYFLYPVSEHDWSAIDS